MRNNIQFVRIWTEPHSWDSRTNGISAFSSCKMYDTSPLLESFLVWFDVKADTPFFWPDWNRLQKSWWWSEVEFLNESFHSNYNESLQTIKMMKLMLLNWNIFAYNVIFWFVLLPEGEKLCSFCGLALNQIRKSWTTMTFSYRLKNRKIWIRKKIWNTAKISPGKISSLDPNSTTWQKERIYKAWVAYQTGALE